MRKMFLLLALAVLVSRHATSAEPETDKFVFGGCTQQKYSPEDTGYAANVEALLTSLVNSATYSAYNNFTVAGASAGGAVSGLFQCRGDLSMPDCATCVVRAASRLPSLCPDRPCGAALQLQGCYIKYDNASFVGSEDKTVVLRKCGPPMSDGDVSARVDAVLESFSGFGGGAYREGGAGDVRGVAQCVGDLSLGECRDCTSEAIKRLKTDCGQVTFGDLFLAKCYVRYSTAGAHLYATTEDHSHEKSSSDGEKTFAVIIGLLAGVALIIIFLAFLRKICEGSGK